MPQRMKNRSAPGKGQRELLAALQALRGFTQRAKSQQQQRQRPARHKNKVNPAARSLLPDSAGHACAIHYGQSLANPFDTVSGACVPKFPTVESAKRVFFASGTGSTNVNGLGGIIVGSNFSNDGSPNLVTESAYAPSTPNSLPIGTDTGVGGILLNSPYASVEFGSAGKVQCRLVSLGVRIRYIGTELNMGGRVYAVESPSHGNVADMTESEILAYDKNAVVKHDFGREWISVVYQPRYPEDFAYASDAFGNSTGVAFLGMMIQSAAPNQPFEYEIYTHGEFIGSPVRGKTVSHAEPVMTDRIVSAFAQAPPHAMNALANRPQAHLAKFVHHASKKGASVWQQGGELLGSAFGPLGRMAGGAAGKMLGKLF